MKKFAKNQWKKWAKQVLNNLPLDGDEECVMYPNLQVLKKDLLVFDQIISLAPNTKGRNDLVDLEQVIKFGKRHANILKKALDDYTKNNIKKDVTTNWNQMIVYSEWLLLAGDLEISGTAKRIASEIRNGV